MLEALPAAPIVIFGGGYIATEFAGIFAGLGGQVHLMYRADKPLRGWVAQEVWVGGVVG
jgi:glutathione reductase (NADPH)